MATYASRAQTQAAILNRRHVRVRKGGTKPRSCVVTANSSGVITAKCRASGETFTTQAAWAGGWVRGTGYPTTEPGTLYARSGTIGIYEHTGADNHHPAWTARTIAGHGASAPVDGVSTGATGTYRYVDALVAADPTTGWYKCTDGTLHLWTPVTVDLTGTAVPTDGVAQDWTSKYYI